MGDEVHRVGRDHPSTAHEREKVVMHWTETCQASWTGLWLGPEFFRLETITVIFSEPRRSGRTLPMRRSVFSQSFILAGTEDALG